MCKPKTPNIPTPAAAPPPTPPELSDPARLSIAATRGGAAQGIRGLTIQRRPGAPS